MTGPGPLADPQSAIHHALNNPIGSDPLPVIVRRAVAANPDATAVVVVSDNTRPVPYSGEQGILWPVVSALLDNGVKKTNLVVLVATGTHRPLCTRELMEMLDQRIFDNGIRVVNHNCRGDDLVYLCKTSRGSPVHVNRLYLEADLKILTGLVESHFMAGVSGGRKSVCPGLISESSTYVFHGPKLLESPNARDLVLEGNPVHEESLEIAETAGVDFIVNVTLNSRMRLTGVFAGDLREAHESAAAHLSRYVSIPIERKYDLVVTHAGFVGVNHYQAAKAAVVALPALAENRSRLIMIADHTDPSPLGSSNYRTVLHLLKLLGAERFIKLIFSEDWVFIPEQWQVQMWAKVFRRLDMRHLIYAAAGLSADDESVIPGVTALEYLRERGRDTQSLCSLADVAEAAVLAAADELRLLRGSEPSIAVLQDGPYGMIGERCACLRA
jgi:nickel-dependent lactate racemase